MIAAYDGYLRPCLSSRVNHHHIQHATVFIGELVLAQLAQAPVLVQHHLARGLHQIAAQYLHEGGLAAVCADQTIAVAVAEFDGHVLEQGLGPELHGDVCGGKHEKLDLENS